MSKEDLVGEGQVELVNLMPYGENIVIYFHRKMVYSRVIPNDGAAEVEFDTMYVRNINGIPITKKVTGIVTGLPELKDNTIYIVSKQVMNAVQSYRKDVVTINTETAVKDYDGNIIGITEFDVTEF